VNTLPSVFVTRQIPAVGLELLADQCDINVWQGELPPPKTRIIEAVHHSAGLLCLLTDPVDVEVLAAGQQLRVISQMAVGVDNVDLAEATARGIPVGHTPGVLTEATADMAFALLMAAARRIPEGIEKVRTGRWLTWEPMGLLGVDVWGATLGIIGLGRIGSAVARRATGFAMRVLYYDPRHHPELEAELEIQFAGLDELLSQSDFVSLHCPLVPETEHLINRRALRLMKPSSILINTARGPIVDQEALVEALVNGWICRAAVDVTDPEPLPADHALAHMPNCIVVPHIASATIASRNRMATMAADNLLAGLSGRRLPHCANPTVYENL
jgi:glyoxylate reductase